MNPKLPLLLFSLLPIGLSTALPSRSQEVLNEAPVLWEPVVRSSAPQPQQPGGRQSTPAEEIVWELVTESKAANGQPSKTTNPQTEVVWSLVPETLELAETTPATKAGASASAQQVVWEEIPGSVNPLGPATLSTVATKESTGSDEQPPADAVAFENSQPARRIPPPPPPPALQALNRSIAFGDGSVGPDIGWRVPSGLRWSRRWFGDATLQAISRRKEDDKNWFSIGSGDGEWIAHANVLQTKNWSLGLNHSFRSVQNNRNIAGGSTGPEDGMSTGFRIARAIGDTGGISFGAEQLIQWDDKTDTGRNLYVMATKGWWLGDQGKDYPLIIANGGFGTGKLSYDQPLRLACIYNVEPGREGNFIRDKDLCWSPIGSIAIVFNEAFGLFTEYSGTTTSVNASLNLTSGIPIRLTGGLSFADSRGLRDFYRYRWTLGASIGF